MTPTFFPSHRSDGSRAASIIPAAKSTYDNHQPPKRKTKKMSLPSSSSLLPPIPIDDDPANTAIGSRYLCLTILGYKKPGLTDAQYRWHMNRISAPLTKDLMAKCGILRWTQVHNTERTRGLMGRVMDGQMLV
jgi:hypothetical protein